MAERWLNNPPRTPIYGENLGMERISTVVADADASVLIPLPEGYRCLKLIATDIQGSATADIYLRVYADEVEKTSSGSRESKTV